MYTGHVWKRVVCWAAWLGCWWCGGLTWRGWPFSWPSLVGWIRCKRPSLGFIPLTSCWPWVCTTDFVPVWRYVPKVTSASVHKIFIQIPSVTSGISQNYLGSQSFAEQSWGVLLRYYIECPSVWVGAYRNVEETFPVKSRRVNIFSFVNTVWSLLPSFSSAAVVWKQPQTLCEWMGKDVFS